MLCAKYRVSEDQVRAVPAPEYTDTWHPLSHGELLDQIEKELLNHGLTPKKKDFSLAVQNQQMFAVFDLDTTAVFGSEFKDFGGSVGIRNSIDKSLSAAFCIGSRVFVCDNLAFSGENQFTKKHTNDIELELPVLISSAVGKFKEHFENNEIACFKTWKDTEVATPIATEMIAQCAQSGIIPRDSVLDVREEFLYPSYSSFEHGTVWTLFNAFTTYISHKKREATPFSNLARTLGLFTAFRARWNPVQTILA